MHHPFLAAGDNVTLELHPSDILKFLLPEEDISNLKELHQEGEVALTNDLLISTIEQKLEEVGTEDLEEMLDVLTGINLRDAFENLVSMPYLEEYSIYDKAYYNSLKF